MTALYQHVRQKNATGIPYSEAVQLFLWAYCTRDILPPDLRSQTIDRQYLIDTFAQLATEHLITGLPEESRQNAAPRWAGLLDDLLANRILLDPHFPARIGRYV